LLQKIFISWKFAKILTKCVTTFGFYHLLHIFAKAFQKEFGILPKDFVKEIFYIQILILKRIFRLNSSLRNKIDKRISVLFLLRKFIQFFSNSFIFQVQTKKQTNQKKILTITSALCQCSSSCNIASTLPAALFVFLACAAFRKVFS